MDVSLGVDEGEEKSGRPRPSGNFGDEDSAKLKPLLICRLCGAHDSDKMLHLSDTYSIGVTVTESIYHLLDSISSLLKVQEECEESMSKCICMACFNTAVDIQAFVDSAINFQKSTIFQLFPDCKLEEVPQKTLPGQVSLKESTTFLPYNVNKVKGDSTENISSNLLDLEGGSYQCTPDSHKQEKVLANKNNSYNIITELIDPGTYQGSKGTSNETVIEISSSSGPSQQPGGNHRPVREEFVSVSGNRSKTLSHEPAKENDFSTNRDVSPLTNRNESPREQPAEAQELHIHKTDSKKCPTCGKAFARQSQLKSHLTSHSETRPFDCSICHMKFKYRRNLVEHTNIHDNPPSFICSICGLTFKQRSNLLKHERTHQKANRLTFQCSLCGKRYSQSSHLKMHMRNFHGDSHGYTCNQCNAVLQSRSSLRRHTATVHANSKKFSCPHCNKGFNNTQNYQGHIRSHTGERPYCCTTCDKTFTTSKALSRHRLIHQGIKSHKCSQCGKAFLELCDLKRHVKRHLLKRAKNASKDLASKYQESAANISVQAMVPGMNTLNLMVLPDSILFTQSQQLLDNSGSSATEIILPDGKLNTTKTTAAASVLETSLMQHSEFNIQAAATLPKESTIMRNEGEVLGSPEFISSSQVAPPQEGDPVPVIDNASVLQPSEVMTTTSLHSPSLPSNNIGIQESVTTVTANGETSKPPECRPNSESATMVVLSSIGTETDYLPVTDHVSVIETTRSQPSERVLSHATW